MATWCSPTAAPRKARFQAPSLPKETRPRVVRRLDTEAARCLARTASGPISPAGAVLMLAEPSAILNHVGDADGANKNRGPGRLPDIED